jgi:putative transposase
MHLTLKQETTRPACENHLRQQVRFDDFVRQYNTQAPA